MTLRAALRKTPTILVITMRRQTVVLQATTVTRVMKAVALTQRSMTNSART
ncbi:hypothetical protein NECAME_06068 [Necator americanus]|uniref:Uncharacterized protein n=1 Tax=Necator americanus TaxID=51031 RepID=W2TVG8_NECAM|nr:hypothetical protein NECAME_06068 [Necator americanus]ETN86095.1 hypothetical protein NECAME_06068 [Necator americanus]